MMPSTPTREPVGPAHSGKRLHIATVYVAVVILLLTVGFGLWVDTRHNQIHQQQKEILLGLERLQRFNQSLTHLLTTAALEQNALRISGYDTTVNALQLALELVAKESSGLRMAPEINALLDENSRLREQEQAVIELMRNGQWVAAQSRLFGTEYQRARRIYEINTDTVVMAVASEVQARATEISDWRQTFTSLRVLSLLMLLWAGAMFSRQLRRELQTQERLRSEVTQANAELEERVRTRTADLEAARKAMELLSITDALTGLSNRRHFDQALESEWSRATRQSEPLAVLMIDVDQFKSYNDRYGHQAGDYCLQEVAGVLAQHARRAGELSARYGGEEFVLLLPHCSQAEANARAEAVRAAVEALGLEHLGATGRSVVTVSIGVASAIPRADTHREGLLRSADEALYAAKAAGRNRVVANKANLTE